MKFSENLLIGGSFGSEQIEGLGNCLKSKTEWDLYFNEKPQDFFQGQNNTFTIDFTRNYEADLDLLKKSGCNSLVFSFSWSRIMPEINVTNKMAVKYYHDFINAAKARKINLIGCLFYSDLPAYLFETKLDGWCNKETVDCFVRYANLIFREYGSKIKYFATLNDPNSNIHGYSGFKLRYPLLNNLELCYRNIYFQTIAHAHVVKLYRSKYKKIYNGQIGIILNWIPFYPRDGINFKKQDKIAANSCDILYNSIFFDPVLLGGYNREIRDVLVNATAWSSPKAYDTEELKDAVVDWLGINFLTIRRVQHVEKWDKNAVISRVFQYYNPNKKNKNFNYDTGFESNAKAILDLANLIKTKYNNIPWMICSSGIGVANEQQFKDKNGQINDTYRIKYIHEHLKYLHRAISEGSNIIGYHVTSPIDSWMFESGFKSRYGLIEIDLNTMKRIPKKSFEWFFNFSKTRTLIDSI